MQTLGVRVQCAHSPQAKGRVERRHQVFQDRLVKELRLAGIQSIKAANRFLDATFLPELNARFTVPAVLSLVTVRCRRRITRGSVGGSRRVRPRAAPVRPRPPPTAFRSRKARLRTRWVKAGDWEIGSPSGRATKSWGETRSTCVAVAGADGGAAKDEGTFSSRFDTRLIPFHD